MCRRFARAGPGRRIRGEHVGETRGVQVEGVGQSGYGVLVAAMSVGCLQFDDAVLPDADTGLFEPWRAFGNGASGEFHDGDVEGEFR